MVITALITVETLVNYNDITLQINRVDCHNNHLTHQVKLPDN
jgi:hypothetical protein